MKEQKQNKLLPILITIFVMLVLASGAIFGTWYLMDKQIKEAAVNNAKQIAEIAKQLENSRAQTSTLTTTSQAAPETLTKTMIENSEYNLGSQSFRLNDGKYQQGDVRATLKDTENLIITKNNLGIVIVNYNTGGTGFFYYLVSFKAENGVAKQVTAISLGDRPEVKSLTWDTNVALNMNIAGPNDPSCCPSQSVTYHYSVDVNGALIKQ